MAAAVCCIFSGCGEETVNLADYIEVSFSGNSGSGTASTSIDYTALRQKIESNVSKDMDLTTRESAESDFIYAINTDLSESYGLTNGDKITLTATCDTELGKFLNINFVCQPKEIEVSGLTETQEVDVFKDITVKFSGTSPAGKAQIVNNSTDKFVKEIYFSLDKSSDLSNGDTVTITADVSSYEEENYGCVAKTTEKTFKVEGLDEYMSKFS